VFAGRVLEYVRTHELAALVRRSKKTRGIVPSWAGGRMPLSSELADATLAVLGEVADRGDKGCDGGDGIGDSGDPELIAAGPMLDAQRRLSRLPTAQTLLVEHHRSREGSHLFVYPFAGRAVHIGLASLIAWRLARDQPNSFSIGVNDYGFEILAAEDIAIDRIAAPPIFSSDSLREDVLASLMSSVLAHKRFREIARVAGLVFTGYPGAPQSARALQASSGLFYEVFRQHDPGNRLLAQADAEVLALELDLRQLDHALQRMRAMRMTPVTLSAPSPFALALMVERFREQLTTEQLADRVARIVREAEAAMGLVSPAPGAQALRQTLEGDAEGGSAAPRRGRPVAKARPRSTRRIQR
jgi:ATP-dependent Lhr-like helicase